MKWYDYTFLGIGSFNVLANAYLGQMDSALMYFCAMGFYFSLHLLSYKGDK